MFFRKNKELKEGAKKFDKLITWLIIGGALASVVGLSKTNKGKEITKNIQKETEEVAKKSYSFIWKVLVGTLKILKIGKK